MFLTIKKITLAAAVILGSQAFAAGDQTGLLSDLYSSKQDYDMYINKGIAENQSLTGLLEQTHKNLAPFSGRAVSIAKGWTAPIRQTVDTFAQEFAVENKGLTAVFATVTSTMDRLNSQQKGNCGAVNQRYQAARAEMMRIWNERDRDSKNLMGTLTQIADQLDAAAGGTYLVKSEWLGNMVDVMNMSVASRGRYITALKALDGSLVRIYEDIRVCFQLD